MPLSFVDSLPNKECYPKPLDCFKNRMQLFAPNSPVLRAVSQHVRIHDV